MRVKVGRKIANGRIGQPAAAFCGHFLGKADLRVTAGAMIWRKAFVPARTIKTVMRPILHPSLVNGRSGDPALYVETLFEKRAIQFDLGDISNLSPRKIQRLEHVFVSHAHIDHFIGFDRLLRVLVGREKTVNLYGPRGFIDHVHHKLHAYRWNLVDRIAANLVFVVTEIDALLNANRARFRLRNGFAAEAVDGDRNIRGALYSEPTFRVSTAVGRLRIRSHSISSPFHGFGLQDRCAMPKWH